eukprot:6737089-Ditylum_brightwellii.AAC.1
MMPSSVLNTVALLTPCLMLLAHPISVPSWMPSSTLSSYPSSMPSLMPMLVLSSEPNPMLSLMPSSTHLNQP